MWWLQVVQVVFSFFFALISVILFAFSKY